MRRWIGVTTTLGVLLLVGTGHAQMATKRALDLEGAKQIIAAAAAAARKHTAGGAIAVVDDGGHVVALERLDGTFAAAATISIGKARTAAMFRRSTRAFEDIIKAGRTAMVALPDFTPLQGGIPIVVDGQVIGGIGVSGAASAHQDEEIAQIGASALRAPAAPAAMTSPVVFFDAARVAAAFAKGMPLLEVEGYKVHASRRDAPGMAEIHHWETDVIYVLEGSATFVVGGTVVEGQTTEPGQIRGPAIQGGESRRLTRGDVVVVPQGVAHWFKEVQGPLLYFVVKPIATVGAAR